MARHQTWGKKGEEDAAAYLAQKGFTILHRNWRHSHYEIDIIAEKEGVDKRKFNRLLNAADEFLHQHQQYRHVQYDIVAIRIRKNSATEYFFIEDVYL
jgi:putative endonuclease